MAFLNALPGAIAEGLIWGLMAIGVYVSYKILDIADLSVDGSICTGGCVFAMLLAGGMPVWLSLLIAFLAGALAGTATGILHTVLGIPAIALLMLVRAAKTLSAKESRLKALA
jgi:putative ABC transport system permease protein